MGKNSIMLIFQKKEYIMAGMARFLCEGVEGGELEGDGRGCGRSHGGQGGRKRCEGRGYIEGNGN